ncbi:hypothetical protein PV516_19225 [Streptomyces scabiei]|uniref:hypothetical protein n=1 Tax=Streptomyces scabiei TaxID=1930 RepID=UPI0029B572BF|nr:hypothetical protein [Streptomyces scabiei]MDX3165921.1 hypothetical protein [Streptomyces scabiei]
MPNRQAVIKVLAQDVVGAQRWNGLKGECVTMPTEAYYEVEDAAEAILERVARAVSWPRLLREASWRHLHLHPDKENDKEGYATGVCSECLVEALLADDRGAPDWDKHPESPRRRADFDWPTAVAANTKHRTRAHWHPYMPPATPAESSTEAATEDGGTGSTSEAEKNEKPRIALTAASENLLREIAKYDTGDGVLFRHAARGRYTHPVTFSTFNARTFYPLTANGLVTDDNNDEAPVRMTETGRKLLADLDASAKPKRPRTATDPESPAAQRALQALARLEQPVTPHRGERRGIWTVGGRDGYSARESTFYALEKAGYLRIVQGAHLSLRMEITDAGRKREQRDREGGSADSAVQIPEEIVHDISEASLHGVPGDWPKFSDRDSDSWFLTTHTHDGDRVMLPSAGDTPVMLQRDAERLYGPLREDA